MDNFMQYVSELEQVVSTAKKSVFSGSDVIVNRAQVLDIIDRMRSLSSTIAKTRNKGCWNMATTS